MLPTAVVSNAAFAVSIPLFLGHGLILSGLLTLAGLVSSTLLLRLGPTALAEVGRMRRMGFGR
jgi:hypothetical protein